LTEADLAVVGDWLEARPDHPMSGGMGQEFGLRDALNRWFV
jgi:hypothetical protein